MYYVFSPCASSAYNNSSGRKTRTGSRRQRDRILASPMVLLYETPGVKSQLVYVQKCVLIRDNIYSCTNLHLSLDSVIGVVLGQRRLIT